MTLEILFENHGWTNIIAAGAAVFVAFGLAFFIIVNLIVAIIDNYYNKDNKWFK